MSERSTDLGGAPTEWHDPIELADHVRHLVQHGNAPTPHLPRLRELTERIEDEPLRRGCEAFIALVEQYLAALADGTFLVDELKHEIERYDIAAWPRHAEARGGRRIASAA